MFDVITFGSATWDIFIRDEEMRANKKFLFLPFGSKVIIDELRFSTGGGGINSTATFLEQGFKVAYCGAVGKDYVGNKIVEELTQLGADLSLIYRSKKKATNHSIILSIPDRDRTILAHKGAAEEISFKDILPKRQKAKWFYIAPLSGKLALSFDYLVNFAVANNIKIAANPGDEQLSLPPRKLRKILKKVDILIMNEEEAALMTGRPFKERVTIMRIIKDYSGILVVTRGADGVLVCADNRLYSAKILKSKVIDKTGAGDSFGAGFVSAIMDGQGIEEAIQLASANATSCLGKWGAKNGLLKKGQRYKKIKIIEEKL